LSFFVIYLNIGSAQTFYNEMMFRTVVASNRTCIQRRRQTL